MLQFSNLLLNADGVLLIRRHLHFVGELRIVYLIVHHVAFDVDWWKADLFVL